MKAVLRVAAGSEDGSNLKAGSDVFQDVEDAEEDESGSEEINLSLEGATVKLMKIQTPTKRRADGKTFGTEIDHDDCTRIRKKARSLVPVSDGIRRSN